MASSSRALLVAAAVLASAPLARAGDKAAFATTQEDRVDLSPVEKPATADPAADAAPTADAASKDPVKGLARNNAGKSPASHRETRLARNAAKALASVALKASFPTAPADAVPSASAPAGKTEAAAPTPPAPPPLDGPREAASGTVSDLLAKHARLNGVPLKLAEAVVRIESRGNAHASNRGALGLMQIKYGTARAAGFGGPAVGLFAADTNLRYGMKILGDAFRAAGGDTCGALMRFQSGHYATHMSPANRAYCTRARAIMAGA